jgi:hypothetical protein
VADSRAFGRLAICLIRPRETAKAAGLLGEGSEDRFVLAPAAQCIHAEATALWDMRFPTLDSRYSEVALPTYPDPVETIVSGWHEFAHDGWSHVGPVYPGVTVAEHARPA